MFILHCFFVVVSCSTHIFISAPTTALQHCNKVNISCSALCWAAVDKKSITVMQVRCSGVWTKLKFLYWYHLKAALSHVCIMIMWACIHHLIMSDRKTLVIQTERSVTFMGCYYITLGEIKHTFHHVYTAVLIMLPNKYGILNGLFQ